MLNHFSMMFPETAHFSGRVVQMLEKGYASTMEQGLNQRRDTAIKFTIDGEVYRMSCMRSHN